MIFSTGVTPNFAPRAAKLWPSVRAHGIPFLVHLVDHPVGPPPEHCAGLPTRRVRYADVVPPVPKTQLQHGAWTQFWTGPEDEVVGFCDADAFFQRAPTAAELALMDAPDGVLLAGRNKPDPAQTLADEAQCLTPTVDAAELARRFPGFETMKCRNWGFVVGRVNTWRTLLGHVRAHWADTARCFRNPAMVQWVSLYCAQRYLRLDDLPLSIHTHGHLGRPPGVTCDADGIWRVDGETILYVHAL